MSRNGRTFVFRFFLVNIRKLGMIDPGVMYKLKPRKNVHILIDLIDISFNDLLRVRKVACGEEQVPVDPAPLRGVT